MAGTEKVFQTIREACETTGLSQFYLRRGCKDGTIPHVMSGQTYYIDVPAMLDKLRGGYGVGNSAGGAAGGNI